MTTNYDDFSTTLGNALISNLPNWYGAENWDCEVLPYKESLADWIFTRIQRFSRSLLKNLVLLRKSDFLHLANGFNALGNSIHELSTLYHRLEDDQSRSLLISLLTYRLMGYRKVMLPVNSPAYWEMRKVAGSLEKSKSAIKLKFRNWVLNHQDLHKIGYPLEVYLSPVWVATTFSVYHNPDDLTTISNYIADSGLGYEFFLGHFTIYRGETILFARIRNNS